MVTIIEKRNGREILYEKNITYQDITSKNLIEYHATEVTYEEKKYYLLYDSRMEPVRDVYCYINNNTNLRSDNSKSKALHAMKLVFCFQEIVGKEIEDFNLDDIGTLRAFLLGFSYKGQNVSYHNLTQRSRETVNSYLSIYREYLSYFKKKNRYLTEIKGKKSHWSISDVLSGEGYSNRVQYKSNLAVRKKKLVPDYASVNEFKDILEVIRMNKDVCGEIIIRLMFEAGLRIGEVLGLTNEDVLIEKSANIYVPTVYIRNRVSDTRRQLAKTCINVSNINEYMSRDYNTEDIGYQKVYISKDLYSLIGDYVETEHSYHRLKNKDRYFKKTIADSVLGDNENFYLFINSKGRPLSYESWDKRLRGYYEELGEDYRGVSQSGININHRFRHGFAMFLRKINVEEKAIQQLMRHSSIVSTMIYYRPTIEEVNEMKQQFINFLYEEIPSLKEREFSHK